MAPPGGAPITRAGQLARGLPTVARVFKHQIAAFCEVGTMLTDRLGLGVGASGSRTDSGSQRAPGLGLSESWIKEPAGQTVGPEGLEPTTRGLNGRRITATVASTCDYVPTGSPTSPKPTTVDVISCHEPCHAGLAPSRVHTVAVSAPDPWRPG